MRLVKGAQEDSEEIEVVIADRDEVREDLEGERGLRSCVLIC